MAHRDIAMVDLHELLRLHGQVLCGRRPQCAQCPVAACRSRSCDFSGMDTPVVSLDFWDDWRELLLA